MHVAAQPIQLERVTITAGSAHLAGLVYVPPLVKRPCCVVLAHGFTASKESMDLLAGYLCGRGYGCVTFDFRGHKLGGSTGELTGVHDAMEDMQAASAYAMARFHSTRCALVGHSMGGMVALSLAGRIPSVAGVAAIAIGTHPSRGFATVIGQAMHVQRAGYVAGIEPKRLLEQLDGLGPTVAALYGRPSLFVIARSDVLVAPDTVRELAALAGPDAQVVEVAASHLDAPQRCRGAVAAWLDRLRLCVGIDDTLKSGAPSADNQR